MTSSNVALRRRTRLLVAGGLMLVAGMAIAVSTLPLGALVEVECIAGR